MTASPMEAIASQFDDLDDRYDVDGMYALMCEQRDTQDPDLVWRLSYAVLEKGRMLGGEAKKEHVYQAFEHIKRGVELDDKNPHVLMWFCILLSEVSEYEGIKTKIANSYKCKEYMLRGLTIKPDFAPLMHCMGVWCFEVSSLSWLERKGASVMFATPPTSSFEQALQYFEDAEKARPGFYNANNLMLAKTLLKLKKDKERVKDLLMRIATVETKTLDDIEAKDDATALLSKEFSIKV